MNFIDSFAALLTVIFSPSLLGIFCLLMTLCIMDVTVVCMHVSICHWIVTNTLQYVFQWIRLCI